MPPLRGSASNSIAHRVKYDHDRAIVRLVDPIQNETMFWVCDEVDLALEYYCYRHIELHIDSPGGSVAALEYYLSRLSYWRTIDGFVLETLALTAAASAAAMILALGTIGYRRAYRSAQLLFHDARIRPHQDETWTHEELEHHRRALMEADERMITRLAEHVYHGTADDTGSLQIGAWKPGQEPGPETSGHRTIRSAAELKEVYHTLSDRDMVITPETALALNLVDRIDP